MFIKIYSITHIIIIKFQLYLDIPKSKKKTRNNSSTISQYPNIHNYLRITDSHFRVKLYFTKVKEKYSVHQLICLQVIFLDFNVASRLFI